MKESTLVKASLIDISNVLMKYYILILCNLCDFEANQQNKLTLHPMLKAFMKVSGTNVTNVIKNLLTSPTSQIISNGNMKASLMNETNAANNFL